MIRNHLFIKEGLYGDVRTVGRYQNWAVTRISPLPFLVPDPGTRGAVGGGGVVLLDSGSVGGGRVDSHFPQQPQWKDFPAGQPFSAQACSCLGKELRLQSQFGFESSLQGMTLVRPLNFSEPQFAHIP